MGDMIMIDGSGLTATFTDNGVKVEPSTIYCDTCNDDRLLHEGDLLRCYSCHFLQAYEELHDLRL